MSRQYREKFHLLGEVHPQTPREPCRPGMEHVGECGPTGDDFECACGCSGDDRWCVAEAEMICEIDGCWGVKVAADLCENHLEDLARAYELEEAELAAEAAAQKCDCPYCQEE